MTDLSWPEDRARGSAPCSTGERERGRLDRGPRCRRLAGPGEGCAFTGSFVFKSVYGARGAFNLHKFNYLCSGKRKMEFRVHSLYHIHGRCMFPCSIRIRNTEAHTVHTQCTRGAWGVAREFSPCGAAGAGLRASDRFALTQVPALQGGLPAPHHARHGTRTAGLCFRKFALRTHVVTANLL